MSTADKAFRKNFIVAVIMHVALLGGIIFWEGFLPHNPANDSPSTEIMIPAALLGDLPKGPGHGTGAYKAPKEPAGANAVAGPNQDMVPADETVAPKAKAPAAAGDPDDILIPKKKATETQKKAAVAKATAKTTTTAAKTKSETKVAAKSKKAGTGTSAESADDFRKRFASALQKSGDGEDGTPYGDGKVAGGGTGKSNHLGSPDGSPDGVPGGVGQGTPFWQYYQGVHDQMYQAWEQPGTALDKKLVATVMIKVAKDGSITDVELHRSSGNKLMDESALTAARKVLRLDPPPDALVKGSTADITVDFQVEG